MLLVSLSDSADTSERLKGGGPVGVPHSSSCFSKARRSL